MDKVLRGTIQRDHSGKPRLPRDQGSINRELGTQIDDMHRQIGTIHQTIDEMTVNFNYAPQSNTGGTSNDITEVKQDVTEVKQDVSEIKQDVTTVKQDVTTVKQDVTTVKQDVTEFKQDVTTVKQDVTTVKQDVTTVKQDMTEVKQDVTTVKQDVTTVKQDVTTVKQDVTEVKQDMDNLAQSVVDNMDDLAQVIVDNTDELNSHILTSDNNFSIDNVNTISNLFGEALSRLNWVINLINEKKSSIIEQNSYSKVIRPILELKYGSQREEDDFNIYVFQFAKRNMLYFYQSTPSFDDMYIYNLNEPHKTLFKDLNEKFYDPTAKLISDNQDVLTNTNRLYNCLFGLTVNGIDLQIQYIMKDLLDDTKYVIISETLGITKKMAQINSYDTIPSSFNAYLETVQTKFNNLATEFDPTLGTVYQFGPNNKFNTLRVVSSKEYPSWNGDLITNAYIPGSNIDMPSIIYQINIQLNRQYTGVSSNEIVIVSYDIGHVYYLGVIKMLRINGYDGLCYQLQSININDYFPTSVTMTGDVDIQGNLNVLNYDGEKVISSDNTRKIVSFHDKIGINQQPYEVNALLDIDNLTQQSVLDLFDTFSTYRIVSSDVIKVISGYANQPPLSLLPPNEMGYGMAAASIIQLFTPGQPLFDYKNQCTIFAVPIKSTIIRSEVLIIHADEEVVGTGDDGETASGRAASIINSESSLKRLQEIMKDINQLGPEIAKANDPHYIFSFVELLVSEDTQSYMTSSSVFIYKGLAVFAMTYLDVTNTMNDNSTGKPLIKILDYVSREMRFINYASLLFKDTSLIDNDGNYTTDTNGNINLSKAIKNNPFFSNRFDLRPESYIFSLNLSKNDKYVIMEGATHWSDRYPVDVWSGDDNVQVVVELINGQNEEIYNKRMNSTFAVNYRWRGGRKISFTNTILVGKNRILIGSGFDLNSLLNQSMVVNGDNTISGNFSVNDSNNNNIFKVDNVNKSITNTYKVGIGIAEPKSSLDIKDTTINDVLDEIDAGSEQYKILNKIAEKLRENAPFDNTTNFANIIDNVYSDLNIEQTHDNYVALLEVNMNTMLADDIKICSHWLYPDWNGQYLKNIQDPVNQFSLNSVKTNEQSILNNELIYDNAIILTNYKFVFGWKFSRIKCLVINNKMYFLRSGTNIQDFGLRPDSNSNITRLMDNGIRGNMMISRIRSYMNNTIAYNNNESLDNLTRLNKEYNDIPHSKYILTIDANDINSITFQEIKLFDVRNIPSDELQRLFNYFDADGDGYLSNSELINFSNATGFGLNDLINSEYDTDNGDEHSASGSGLLINDGKISLHEIMTKFVPIKYGEIQQITNFTDYNRVAKYKNFWVMYFKNQYNLSINQYNVIHYEDLYSDFIAGMGCISKTGSKTTLLCGEMRVQDVLKPSLAVAGDARIDGDLMITSSKHAHHNVNANYVSIDPDKEFMGIGTDERFINYSDNIYSTTSNAYAARHNLHVQGSRYPMMVADRIQETSPRINSDLDINDVTTDDIKYFTTYTAFTAKRTSRLYTFDEIVAYSKEWTKRAVQPGDTITRYNYGSDLSFEVRDATDRSVEIGQVGMCIDRVDSNNKLRGGFGVTTVDPASDENATFATRRRSLMYLDNDSQLFVKKINLNGGVLTTDDGTNLFWNGRKVNDLDQQPNQVNQINLGGKLLTVNSDGDLVWGGKRVMTEQPLN
jgi:uncharacterized coiled-coil DUF342 family protein